jgi:hypothetical protein
MLINSITRRVDGTVLIKIARDHGEGGHTGTYLVGTTTLKVITLLCGGCPYDVCY